MVKQSQNSNFHEYSFPIRNNEERPILDWENKPEKVVHIPKSAFFPVFTLNFSQIYEFEEEFLLQNKQCKQDNLSKEKKHSLIQQQLIPYSMNTLHYCLRNTSELMQNEGFDPVSAAVTSVDTYKVLISELSLVL